MLAGVVAEAELLPSVTRTPPAGAGALRVTVPVLLAPPVSEVGDKDRLPMVPWPADGALMVRFALTELALVAPMEAIVWEATVVVVTLKLPLLWPEGMTMLAGTVAEADELLRVTRTPPAGAVADKVTVAVLLEPPATVVGDREMLPMVPWPALGALMVRFALTEFALVAVMVAVVCEATVVVLTVKVPLD